MAELIARAQAFYRTMFNRLGVAATLHVNNGVSFMTATGAICIVRSYAPHELIGDILASDYRCLLKPSSVASIPVANKDRLEVNGRVFGIISVDTFTRAIAGNVLAYELRLRG